MVLSSFRNFSIVLFTLATVVGSAWPASAQIDPAAQFSPVANPNSLPTGTWSYGYENVPLPNTFNLLTVPVPGPLSSWQAPAFGEVAVYDNATAVNQPFITAIDGAVYAAGEIGMHPGPNDQYAIIPVHGPRKRAV